MTYGITDWLPTTSILPGPFPTLLNQDSVKGLVVEQA